MNDKTHTPTRPTTGELVGIAARGFAMGSADVVPGVSGGTVALVTGIYPRLIATISSGSRALGRFMRTDGRGGKAELKKVDWWFLGALVVGALAAVVTLAKIIEDLLRTQPVRTAGVFLGLIIGTIVIAWRLLRAPGAVHAIVATIVGAIAFLVFGLQSAAATDPSPVVFFVAGIPGYLCLHPSRSKWLVPSLVDRHVSGRARCRERSRAGDRCGLRPRCSRRPGGVLTGFGAAFWSVITTPWSRSSSD